MRSVLPQHEACTDVHDFPQVRDHDIGKLLRSYGILGDIGRQHRERRAAVGRKCDVAGTQCRRRAAVGHVDCDVSARFWREVELGAGLHGKSVEQHAEQVPDLVDVRQRIGCTCDRGAHLMKGPRVSLKDSGVNGFEIRKLAPAGVARWRMSGVASGVTNPNFTLTPSLVKFSSNSIPVIFGMFQSDSTRSGVAALIAASALVPSSASVYS